MPAVPILIKTEINYYSMLVLYQIVFYYGNERILNSYIVLFSKFPALKVSVT